MIPAAPPSTAMSIFSSTSTNDETCTRSTLPVQEDYAANLTTPSEYNAARGATVTFVAVAFPEDHAPPRAPFTPSASPGSYSSNEAENALPDAEVARLQRSSVTQTAARRKFILSG